MSGKPAARLSDEVACPKCGKTAVAVGSPNVLIEGLPAATQTHACGCGAAISDGVISNVFINGMPVAVTGSQTSHNGVITGGASTVTIGNQGGGTASLPLTGTARSGAATLLAKAGGEPPALRADERPGASSAAEFAYPAPASLTESDEAKAVQQRITLRIGVFFDGTGNNSFNAATGASCRAEARNFDNGQARSIATHCERYMLDTNSSYANAETNVWRLFELYQSDAQRSLESGESKASIRIYIEGIGTRSGQPDSLISMGMGTGASGILASVRTFPTGFAKHYDEFRSSNPGVIIEAVEFDIFGFSRGAGAARHFANEILKPDGGLAARGLASCFAWQRARVAINFIGLFDTVTAVADPLRGDWTPANAANPGINLYLPAGCARKVVQLAAGYECRLNFALTSVAPEHQEITLPGVHADIGGGYAPEMEERLLLSRPTSSRVPYGTASEDTVAYRIAQAECERLKRELWFDPASARLTVDSWRNELPHERGSIAEREVFAAVRLERPVRGELALVYLRVMHRLAMEHGVPVKTIPSTPDLAVPAELQGIAEKLQAYVQGARLDLSEAETRLLLSRYVHRSAHWNARIGRGEGILDVVFVDSPTPDGKRNVYPNQRQPGYPQ